MLSLTQLLRPWDTTNGIERHIHHFKHDRAPLRRRCVAFEHRHAREQQWRDVRRSPFPPPEQRRPFIDGVLTRGDAQTPITSAMC